MASFQRALFPSFYSYCMCADTHAQSHFSLLYFFMTVLLFMVLQILSLLGFVGFFCFCDREMETLCLVMETAASKTGLFEGCLSHSHLTARKYLSIEGSKT